MQADGRNVSIDAFELDGAETALVEAIRGYEVGDKNKRDLVLDLTTVMPDRPAIYDPLHPEKTPEATDRDYYNMMRTIGYGWYSNVPWDVFPEGGSSAPSASEKRWWQFWKKG